MELMGTVVALVALVVGLVLGLLAGMLLRGARRGPDGAGETRALIDGAAIRSGLEALAGQVHQLQTDRASWQAQLAQQVDDVRHSTDLLRRETTSLATALRRPQVRGRWGELHLRRAVELAGMVAHCDFEEQVTVRGATGAEDVTLRPDLVVRLAGGKQVVVDAKVPLDAFLDLVEADHDDDARASHLQRHARQFRQHVETLAAKAYWRSLPATPEFVVLFVPGEAFLSAALEADSALIEHAAARKVVLATPTTLIALLRTVAHAWTQEALADKARDIHRLGEELHARLAVMNGHLDKLGRSLDTAVGSYNQAVGSWESRVLVSARRFGDLDVGHDELERPRVVERGARVPAAADIADDVAQDARYGVSSGVSPLGVARDTSA